jgi:hypothetical protein
MLAGSEPLGGNWSGVFQFEVERTRQSRFVDRQASCEIRQVPREIGDRGSSREDAPGQRPRAVIEREPTPTPGR